MSRTSLAVAALAAMALLGACSSDDPSDTATGDAPASSTTAAPSSTPDEGAGGEVPGDTPGGADTPEWPNPCEELTAEEMTAAVGAPTTAEYDEAVNGCSYADADGDEIGVLTVGPGSTLQSIAEYPPPGVTYVTIDGLGDFAAVAAPPEGRGILVMGDVGFDLTRSFGGTPLDVTQLEAALRSIAAS